MPLPGQRRARTKHFFPYMHTGNDPDKYALTAQQVEDERRRKFAIAAPAKPEAPRAAPERAPLIPRPEDPKLNPFLDRLHKWCKYYVFVSPNHNDADNDPIPNPAYMTTGRTFSSIMDAYDFASTYLVQYLSGNDERIAIIILGGYWDEDILLIAPQGAPTDYVLNRVDFYGWGQPVVDGTLHVGPTFDDLTIEGIRFVSPVPVTVLARLNPSPQRWPSVTFRRCVFESFYGTVLWSQRPVRCEDCIFTITQEATALPAFAADPFTGGNAVRKPVVRIEAVSQQFGWSEFYRCWFYAPALKTKFAIGSPTYTGTALQVTAATVPRNWLGTQHPTELRTLYQSGVRLYDCHVHGTAIVDRWKLYGHKTVFNGGTRAPIAAARIPIAAIGGSATPTVARIDAEVELEHSTLVGSYCYTCSIGAGARAQNKWWIRKTDHLVHANENALLGSVVIPAPGGINGLSAGSAIDGSSPSPNWGPGINEYGTTMNIPVADAEWYHSP